MMRPSDLQSGFRLAAALAVLASGLAGAALRARKRLALLGYGNFRDELRGAHDLLVELGIPHDWVDGPRRKHHWDGGWLEETVELLVKMNTPGAKGN